MGVVPLWAAVAVCLWAARGAGAEFADEMLEYDKKCLGEEVFHCLDGGCVTLSQYCDGRPDCRDGSDEDMCQGASATPQECRGRGEFPCRAGGRCVPLAWVCNGEQDCPDASDEMGCDTTTLAPINSTCKGFTCRSGECISALRVCDGVYDCQDRSDETDETACRSKSERYRSALRGDEHTCELLFNGYACDEGALCLPRDNMCDGLADCRDGTDEGPFCADWTTMCSSLNCSLGCRPGPRGPACRCDSLLRFVNGSCVDIDECVEENVQCSQHCTNVYRGFRCSCDPGYTTDFAEYLCFAKGGDALLFLSLRSEIRYFRLKSREQVVITTDAKQAHGVASDGTWVYWVETAQGHQAVLRANLTSPATTKEVILSLGMEDPGDIAIDWLTGLLYLSDGALGHIAVCRPAAGACAALSDGMRHPRYVTLHPQRGQMYWSDWIEAPVIMRGGMDGSAVVKFVEQLQNQPTSLTLDIPNNRLYWVDSFIHNIVLDGSNRRTVLKGSIHHPYSLAVFENSLYWSDLASRTLQACNKFDGKNRRLLLTSNTAIFGIHVYHPVLMPQQKHACTDHDCSHLCLLRAAGARSCACPQHMVLKPDGRTCQEDGKPEYVVVGGRSALLRLRYDTLGRPEARALQLDVARLDAMAYDPTDQWLYTFDGVRRFLHYVDLRQLDQGARLLSARNINEIVDMDYDYVSSTLYWADVGRRTVEVYSTRTSARALLHRFLDGELPLSVCVMPDRGEVMVAVLEREGGTSVHLDKFGMDGRGRQRLLRASLRGPHVKVRYSEFYGGVYIADEGNGVIAFIKADGSGHTIFRELSTSVTSLAVAGRLLFWTDRRTPRLFYTGLLDVLPKIRRLELPMFPNRTQLHLQTVHPPPDPESPLMQHPCARESPPCSHVCAQASHAPIVERIDPTKDSHLYTCLCPPALILHEGTCVKMAECNFHTFYCHSSNACYDFSKRCDGVKDCIGGEDEERCDQLSNLEPNPCPIGKKLCNSRCVPFSAACERPAAANKGCPADKFKCANSTSLCLDRAEVCDGHPDCPDASDEGPALCRSMNCLDTEFMCTQGSCVIKSWTCDGEPDCPDGSDEVNCENKTCSAWQFQCTNGECVALAQRCDGQQDCIDFSDEDYCDRPDPLDEVAGQTARCEDNEYICSSNTSICIPLTARCNNIPDCPGGVDETDCDQNRCREGFFRCTQQLWCVPGRKVCDGHNDCDDGSDETPFVCKTKNVTTSVEPPGGIALAGGPCQGYTCASGRCVDWHDVCDGEPQCAGGDDEGGQCAASCEMAECNHRCQPTPTGPVCVCNAGYRSAGAGRPPCSDVDECAVREPCAHVCHNTPGSFLCSCHHGHALRSDRRSCKVTSGGLSLLYVADGAVWSVSPDRHTRNTVVFAVNMWTHFTGLAYNVREQTMYVTAAMNGTIFEVKKDNPVHLITNVGRPTKIAVDWVSGNVYFVDDSEGARRMRVCHPRRRRCAVLHRLRADAEVAALVVDPVHKRMFYCLNDEDEGVVWSASLYGHGAGDVGTVRRCTGLAADSYKRRLYVADLTHIVLMDYDGEGHQQDEAILYTDRHLDTPTSLALFENYLYFVTNASYRLNRCLVFGERTCEPYAGGGLKADSFLVDHETTQRVDDVEDTCEGRTCEFVCALGDDGPVCLCPDGGVQRTEADTCGTFDDLQVALFDGVRGLSSSSGLAAGLAGAALALAAAAAVLWLLHRRRASADTLMPVHFQNVATEPAPGAELGAPPDEPTVDFRPPQGSGGREFVNPLQFVKDALMHSLGARAQPAKAEAGSGVVPWDQMSSPVAGCDSDTESDLDERDHKRLVH